MPGDDYHFLDSFFEEARKAQKNGTLVRILHYGDSQIEMDRISSVLRQDLQERFGGSGPGSSRGAFPFSSAKNLRMGATVDSRGARREKQANKEEMGDGGSVPPHL